MGKLKIMGKQKPPGGILAYNNLTEYIFLHAIIVRNGFEEEQNLPRDNFSLSAIRLLSAERSEARHV